MVTAEVVINHKKVNHRAPSIRLSRGIGERGTLEFDVLETEMLESHGYLPVEGMQAEVFDHGLGVLNGTIHEIQRFPAVPKPASPAWYRCLVVPWQHRLERHLIPSAVYSGQSAGSIVQQILDVYAPGEVHIGSIQEGLADCGTLFFRGVSVSDALNTLAELSGYVWHVDNLIRLYFSPRELLWGSLEVTAANKNYREPQINSTRADYFNSVLMTINHEAFSPSSIEIAGDASYPEFDLGIPIDKIIGIFLNGVEQSVAVWAEDATATFLYYEGQTKIMWNPASVPPGPEDIVKVELYAVGANVIALEDADEIAARAAIEWDSGRYMAHIEDAECRDYASALARCKAFLDAHAPARLNPALAKGSMPREYRWTMFSSELRTGTQDSVDFVKYIEDLWPGHVVRFAPSTPALEDVRVMIQSVEAQEIAAAAPAGMTPGAGMLRYDIRGIDCTQLAGYFDFYKALAEVGTGGGGSGRINAPQMQAAKGESLRVVLGFQGDLTVAAGTEIELSLPVGKRLQLAWSCVNADTAPVGADATFDAEYSEDAGATWTQIFDEEGAVVLPDGAKQMTVTYARFSGYPTGFSLPARCLIRPQCRQIGSTTAGAEAKLQLIGQIQ